MPSDWTGYTENFDDEASAAGASSLSLRPLCWVSLEEHTSCIRARAFATAAICFSFKPFDGEVLEKCLKKALSQADGRRIL
jgi:hypothetical protein